MLLLGAAILITFLICCVIFWAVPKGHMPWRAVWPGAAFVTFGAGIANWLFPVYLSNVSSLSRFGSTLGFILIALLWFYLLSLALLAGAVINSLRHELHDTGELPYGDGAAAKKPCPTAEARDQVTPCIGPRRWGQAGQGSRERRVLCTQATDDAGMRRPSASAQP